MTTYTIRRAKFVELVSLVSLVSIVSIVSIVSSVSSIDAAEQRNKKIYQCCIYGAINGRTETDSLTTREPNPHYNMLNIAMNLIRELRTRHSCDDPRDAIAADNRAAPALNFFNADGTPALKPPVETSTNPPDFPSRLCPERFLAWLLRRHAVECGSGDGSGCSDGATTIILSQGFLYDPIRVASLHTHTCDYQCVVRAIALGFDYFDSTDDFIDLIVSTTSITHRCARCIDSCICVAAVVRSIITGSDPTTCIQVVKDELVTNGLVVDGQIVGSCLKNVANRIYDNSGACALYFMCMLYHAYIERTLGGGRYEGRYEDRCEDRRDLHLFIEGCAYGLMYTGPKKQISGFIKCRSNIGNFINEF